MECAQTLSFSLLPYESHKSNKEERQIHLSTIHRLSTKQNTNLIIEE